MNILYNEDFKLLTQSANFVFELKEAVFSNDDLNLTIPIESIYDLNAKCLLIYLNTSSLSNRDLKECTKLDILYTDLITGCTNLAFQFSGNLQELILGNNIIKINNINWINNPLHTDIDLESIGNCKSIYISGDSDYISKLSFLDYKNELNCYDSYQHSFTTYINSFGLRIY